MSDDLKALIKSALADYERAGADGSEGARAMRGALNRIKELEAKLAKAVEGFQNIAVNKTTDELTVIEWDTHDTFTILDTCISEARATLAELEDHTDG